MTCKIRAGCSRLVHTIKLPLLCSLNRSDFLERCATTLILCRIVQQGSDCLLVGTEANEPEAEQLELPLRPPS